MEKTSHLSDMNPQYRESETIFRMFGINETHSSDVGLNGLKNYIVGINIPFTCIMSRNQLKKNNLKDGDIDVCFIPLNENLHVGKNTVTPNFDRIIAIEVKTMGYDINVGIKSPKVNQSYYREQADKLCQLGFNDVSLLYIISTTPLEGSTGSFSDCVMASNISYSALEEIRPTIEVNSNDRFSTLGYGFGTVETHFEPYTGGTSKQIYHQVAPNMTTDREHPFRIAFEKKVGGLFQHEHEFTRFPIVMRGCDSCKNKKLTLFPQGEKEPCPVCSKPYK